MNYKVTIYQGET